MTITAACCTSHVSAATAAPESTFVATTTSGRLTAHFQDVGPAGEAECFDEVAADGTPFLLRVLHREERADEAETGVRDQPSSSGMRAQPSSTGHQHNVPCAAAACGRVLHRREQGPELPVPARCGKKEP